ncbi:zinc-dependent metalloprotease [Hyunsoonleella rubra]|uniref:Zinc-dependent metalloprotease n=1 Tax=Hyunsoonleella rubra TaxID=1737062 RepID=A0ABW5TE06_9FLAO
MKQSYFLICFVFALAFSAYSQNRRHIQNSNHSNTQIDSNQEVINSRSCGTDFAHKTLLETDEAYRQIFADNELKIRNKIQSKKASKSLSTTQYTIPVVVHVIHLGEAVGTGTNISDAQIQSAIDHMNVAYSGSGSYITNMNIDFVLAKRDGDCNPSTGIERVDGSGTSDYATAGITDDSGSDNEVQIKNLSKYPNDKFYNIWIVSEINDNNAGSGTQGYAYYPGASSAVDGSVIVYNAFGYDPTGALGYNLKSYTNENVTAIHELGHGLNLRHTFEGDDGDNDGTADQCPVNTDPTLDGDLCADTDPHRRDDGNCGDSGNTCTGAGTNLADVVTNFMAYSSESCQVKFSDDQRDRARAALETTRLSLINYPGGLAPTALPSSSLVSTPATQSIATNSGIGVHSLSMGATSYFSEDAEDENGYHVNSCSRFELSSSTTYNIQVSTGPANDEDVKVYIDYNNDGDFEDSGEEVFSNTNARTHSGSFTVPAISSNVLANTTLWVRVVSDFFPNTISGPNYSPVHGQVEDFSVIINSTLGVEDNSLSDALLLLPNPSNGELTLKYSGVLNLEQVDIYNIVGKKVWTSNLRNFNGEKEIDLARIPAGVYFANIKAEQSQITKKIIIQ